MEKSYEHRQKLLCVFVDLRKAYDSVPRETLWLALERLGVPPTLLSVITNFHSGTQASVRVKGATTDEFVNGLRQGYVMAPVLFNLYFAVVMERWTAVMQESGRSGIKFRYKINGDLFPRDSRKADMSDGHTHDLEYGDYAVLLSDCRDDAEFDLESFVLSLAVLA